MRFLGCVLFLACAWWPVLGAAQNTTEINKIADTMVRLCVGGGRTNRSNVLRASRSIRVTFSGRRVHISRILELAGRSRPSADIRPGYEIEQRPDFPEWRSYESGPAEGFFIQTLDQVAFHSP